MTDFSKIKKEISQISKMTDSERKYYFDNHEEQFTNALSIIEYLEKTQHTKVWHEKVDYLMKNYTITNKNK